MDHLINIEKKQKLPFHLVNCRDKKNPEGTFFNCLTFNYPFLNEPVEFNYCNISSLTNISNITLQPICYSFPVETKKKNTFLSFLSHISLKKNQQMQVSSSLLATIGIHIH